MICLICDQRDDHVTDACPFGDGIDHVATDREEHESCERGTPGCCIRHTRDTPCDTW